MQWNPENPSDTFALGEYNHIKIYTDHNDKDETTMNAIHWFCDKHNLNHNAGLKVTALYYLRGHHQFADYSEVLAGIQEAEEFPAELFEVIHCLTFWNQEGRGQFESHQTPGQKYMDFMLDVIEADCDVYVRLFPEKFMTGRDEKQVWITDILTGQRILLIHF
jgi:hypothetical protein